MYNTIKGALRKLKKRAATFQAKLAASSNSKVLSSFIIAKPRILKKNKVKELYY